MHLMYYLCVFSLFYWRINVELSWIYAELLLERLLWGSLTRGEWIVFHKAQAEECSSFSWFSVSFHCSMMCLSCLPALRDIFYTPMARCSLFVLKVPLNTSQLTNELLRLVWCWVTRCMTWEVEGIKTERTPDWIVLRMTWKVYSCPKWYCSSWVNGEGQLNSSMNRTPWYISFFHPSLNSVLFLMSCLLVEVECQILVF